MLQLDQVNYFGVRHLSPGASWHLLEFLNEKKPSVVLIEGPSDANHLIPYIVDEFTKAPIAALAYTREAPVRTLVYPLAEYSPEYQAMCWAHEKGAECRFIDLPSGVFIGISQIDYTGGAERNLVNIYEEIAKLSEEESYDAHWERCFEHITHKNSFQEGITELGETMRELEENDRDFHRAENLLREAYMRKKIADEINSGTAPENIVVIAGAYHVPSFKSSEHIMTSKEEKALPQRKTSLTLMPYSYTKLSRQSGYGAGNRAPYYFQMMWGLLHKNSLNDLPGLYLSRLARNMNESGHSISSAHIIEAVRLAESLASLKVGWFPVLDDLQDAAATVFSAGNKDAIVIFMSHLEIGSELGRVPENALQVSIQADFERLLKELKLTRFKVNRDQELKLDLRENLNVKSKQSALLSLYRSRFLHRLSFIKVPFGKFTVDDERPWIENWRLNWSPESEINLVESVLLGDSVELAVSAVFVQKVQNCTSVNEAAYLVKAACLCGMTKEIALSKKCLQNLAAGSKDLNALAETCLELSELIKFGSFRKLDTSDFKPLLEELFYDCCLQLLLASNCTAEELETMIEVILKLELVGNNSPEIVDAGLFENELLKISQSDSVNATISGYATAILLEKNALSDTDLADEFCRRISPGIDADLGAGWFEGLAKRNRTYLIRKKEIWKQMNLYIGSLDEVQFKRALVFLRRTFADFSPSEIAEIAQAVSVLFGGSEESKEKLFKIELSESEKDALADLDDLDF